MVRGDEALPAFDVAPDYESYEFTKLDPSKKEDKVCLRPPFLKCDAKLCSRNTSRTNGAGTSQSPLKGRSIPGPTAKSSSRVLGRTLRTRSDKGDDVHAVQND